MEIREGDMFLLSETCDEVLFCIAKERSDDKETVSVGEYYLTKHAALISNSKKQCRTLKQRIDRDRGRRTVHLLEEGVKQCMEMIREATKTSKVAEAGDVMLAQDAGTTMLLLVERIERGFCYGPSITLDGMGVFTLNEDRMSEGVCVERSVFDKVNRCYSMTYTAVMTSLKEAIDG